MAENGCSNPDSISAIGVLLEDVFEQVVVLDPQLQIALAILLHLKQPMVHKHEASPDDLQHVKKAMKTCMQTREPPMSLHESGAKAARRRCMKLQAEQSRKAQSSLHAKAAVSLGCWNGNKPTLKAPTTQQPLSQGHRISLLEASTGSKPNYPHDTLEQGQCLHLVCHDVR